MIALLVLALLQIGTPQGPPLTGATLERRTNEVAALLRCPVCQGMSVADSPSTVALDMKQHVRDLLAQGYTQEQILAEFERSYGQFVLLKPKTPLVWVLPLVALLIGVAVVAIKLRKLSRTPDVPPAAADPYIDRVRELVDAE
jgi:cytochrome c-type biogenesis protein CcmH